MLPFDLVVSERVPPGELWLVSLDPGLMPRDVVVVKGVLPSWQQRIRRRMTRIYNVIRGS